MITSRQLSLLETTRYRLPLGGRWYRTQEAIIREHEKKPGFLLAWDTHNKGKIFGVYQDLTIQEFGKAIDAVPPEHRHAYQLMLENEECPGYLSIRWCGEPDPTHEVLHEALRRLRPKCYHAFSQLPQISSYYNSRTIPGQSKVQHNYYVIVRNMIFSCNHDGAMRDFFDLGMPEIDLGAYTPNKQLLLPNSRAYGSGAPLTKLITHTPIDIGRLMGDPKLKPTPRCTQPEGPE